MRCMCMCSRCSGAVIGTLRYTAKLSTGLSTGLSTMVWTEMSTGLSTKFTVHPLGGAHLAKCPRTGVGEIFERGSAARRPKFQRADVAAVLSSAVASSTAVIYHGE